MRKFCSLFERKIKFDDLEKKIKERHLYLADVKDTKIILITKKSTIQKYIEYIGGIKMKPLTQKLATWVANARQDIQKMSQEFDEWKEDHYLGKDVQQFIAECNKCNGGLEAYIRAQTVDAMATINPDFEKTDSLDADFNTSSQHLARYQQIKQCYEWIGQDTLGLEEKERALNERYSYLTKIMEVKKQLETRIQEIVGYTTELEKKLQYAA
jgi:DNA repair ATPase RecN